MRINRAMSSSNDNTDIRKQTLLWVQVMTAHIC